MDDRLVQLLAGFFQLQSIDYKRKIFLLIDRKKNIFGIMSVIPPQLAHDNIQCRVHEEFQCAH